MIAKMLKMYVVARSGEKDLLLETLRDLGAVHLMPTDPSIAVAEEQTTSALGRIERAIQILSSHHPVGEKPKINAIDAADEALSIQRQHAELMTRLGNLHRQLEHQEPWGDVRLEQFEQLEKAGIKIRLYSVPTSQIGEIQSECFKVIKHLSPRKSLVAIIDQADQVNISEDAQEFPLPSKDAPTIRNEAAEIDANLKSHTRRLCELANLLDELQAEIKSLTQQAEYTVAQRGGLDKERLYALQGWVPQKKAESLSAGLKEAGLDAAVQTFEPAEEETPPTLIEYPRLIKPIKGLFDVLGTVAGYREFDVSAAFMLALPIFAAMLISDAGYGAILFLAPLLLYKKAANKLGAQFTQLLIIIGGVSLLWGLLTNSCFGFGFPFAKPIIPVNMTEHSRMLLMQISFFIGAIHLSLAQLWQAAVLFPSIQFLSKFGWALFIWGMLGVVRSLVLNMPFSWETPWPYLLIFGTALAVIFAKPNKNILKMLGFGIADFPLSVLSAFSDVISYVRLMAVGLASTVLAASFNELAIKAGAWYIAVPTLIFGHSLNLALAMIALFAHGVRLNMLEFSSNLGMQWVGYAFKPFAKETIQEK